MKNDDKINLFEFEIMEYINSKRNEQKNILCDIVLLLKTEGKLHKDFDIDIYNIGENYTIKITDPDIEVMDFIKNNYFTNKIRKEKNKNVFHIRSNTFRERTVLFNTLKLMLSFIN